MVAEAATFRMPQYLAQQALLDCVQLLLTPLISLRSRLRIQHDLPFARGLRSLLLPEESALVSCACFRAWRAQCGCPQAVGSGGNISLFKQGPTVVDAWQRS